MAFTHGVYIKEEPTSLVAPVTADSGIVCVVGASPINQTMIDGEYVEKSDIQNDRHGLDPVLLMNLQDAKQLVGYVAPPWTDKYTISQQLRASFGYYGAGPVIAINVLGTESEHFGSLSSYKVQLKDGVFPPSNARELCNVFIPSIVVKEDGGGTTYNEGDDYVLSFDADGGLKIALPPTSTIDPDEELELSGDILDASKVDDSAIQGAVDVDGARTGLEAIYLVPQKLRKIPGTIVAPSYSDDAVTAALLNTKCEGIGGTFRAIGIIDDVTTDSTLVTSVGDQKQALNLSSPNLVFTPYVYRFGDEDIPASCHWAALMSLVDAGNDGIPSNSPSNKPLNITEVMAGTKTVFHGLDQVNEINGEGICVPRSTMSRGWVAWGNRTTAYPSNSDPKDMWISVRRMFNWVGNTLQLTFSNKVDDPTNRRLIQTIVDSANAWLESLQNSGDMIGAELVFLDSDNPLIQLIDGKIVLRLRMAPPLPAETIEFVLEFYPDFLSNLFD